MGQACFKDTVDTPDSPAAAFDCKPGTSDETTTSETLTVAQNEARLELSFWIAGSNNCCGVCYAGVGVSKVAKTVAAAGYSWLYWPVLSCSYTTSNA